MRLLPTEKVPLIGSEGEKYRSEQLSYQIPKADFAKDNCTYLEERYVKAYETFLKTRNEECLDVAFIIEYCKFRNTCGTCNRLIPVGSLAVCAPLLPDKLYHPSCFTCTTCKELLVDLTYCVSGSELLCIRHYGEKQKPRCPHCEELIFAGSFVNALDKVWHTQHFRCFECDKVLSNDRYVVNETRPLCISCYEFNHSHKCWVCKLNIPVEAKDFSYQGHHWHEGCFSCVLCNTSVIGEEFAIMKEKTYCADCYDKEFASRCDGCGEQFTTGSKKVQYKNMQWHDECFFCKSCKLQVGARSFIITNEKDVYCNRCFEDKIATRCTKCKQILTSGGVNFRTCKGEPYHFISYRDPLGKTDRPRSCYFIVSRMNAKIVFREDRPYCASCFAILFAKRCSACTKPITGQGGGQPSNRYISFEGRHWHSACFACALCEKSLAGKGTFFQYNFSIL